MPDFSALTLRTERLDLRPLEPADAPFLFALKSDPVVQRYGSHAPWTEMQLAVDYIERDRRDVAEGRHVQFAIVRREDGAAIGTCTLYQLDAQCRRADVG